MKRLVRWTESIHQIKEYAGSVDIPDGYDVRDQSDDLNSIVLKQLIGMTDGSGTVVSDFDNNVIVDKWEFI